MSDFWQGFWIMWVLSTGFGFGIGWRLDRYNRRRSTDICKGEKLPDWNPLLDVILDVHSQRGDDVCWMDIDRIFLAAGLTVPDRAVGDKTAMKRNCDRFIDTMCSGGPWTSYAQLESLVIRLVLVARRYEYTLARGERSRSDELKKELDDCCRILQGCTIKGKGRTS